MRLILEILRYVISRLKLYCTVSTGSNTMAHEWNCQNFADDIFTTIFHLKIFKNLFQVTSKFIIKYPNGPRLNTKFWAVSFQTQLKILFWWSTFCQSLREFELMGIFVIQFIMVLLERMAKCQMPPHQYNFMTQIRSNIFCVWWSLCFVITTVSKIWKNIYRSSIQVNFELYGHFRCLQVLCFK